MREGEHHRCSELHTAHPLQHFPSQFMRQPRDLSIPTHRNLPHHFYGALNSTGQVHHHLLNPLPIGGCWGLF